MLKKSSSTYRQQKTFQIFTTIILILHVLILIGNIGLSTSRKSESSTQAQTPPFTWESKSNENFRLITRGKTPKRIISALGEKNEIKPLPIVFSSHVLEKRNSLVEGLDEKNKDVTGTTTIWTKSQNQKPLRLHNETHNHKRAVFPRAKRSLIIEEARKEERPESLIDTREENLEEQLLQAQLLQQSIKVSLREACNNITLICAGEFVNCINGYCKCIEGYVPRPENRELCGERILYNTEIPQTDPTMIALVVCLCLMSVTLCVVLRLFAKARFTENRTIFNTPNPRLMNVSLLKDSKKLIRGGSGPSGPRSPQSPYNDDDGGDGNGGARDSLNSNQSLCGLGEPIEAREGEELLDTQESTQANPTTTTTTYPFKPIENEQPLSQDLPSTGTTERENPIKSARRKFFTGDDKSNSRKNLYRYKQDSVTSNTAV